MFDKIKNEFDYYNKYVKGGIGRFILITIARITLFPIFLILKLYNWVWYED